MPWDARSFRKHNKKLSLAQSKEAADIANHVFIQTGDEGKAIRIANAAFRKEKHERKGR